MLQEEVGNRVTRNRGRYQVAQSCLNRLYFVPTSDTEGGLRRREELPQHPPALNKS